MPNSIPTRDRRVQLKATNAPSEPLQQQQQQGGTAKGTSALSRRGGGLRDWFSQLFPGSERIARAQIQRIRSAMLQELAQLPVPTAIDEKKVASVLKTRELARLQISQAADAEMLWRLRGNLEQILNAQYSPVVVHQRMAEISFMFSGLLHHRTPRPGDNVVQLPTRSVHHTQMEHPKPSNWQQL